MLLCECCCANGSRRWAHLLQVLPTDVDYRVMLTFLEFYATMLRFVHFRLYHSAHAVTLTGVRFCFGIGPDALLQSACCNASHAGLHAGVAIRATH